MSSGTDKIVSSIMSEAQEKADAIIQDANVEVSAINANAEKTAETEKNKILDNGKKQSDMRYQQIISEAKMNARRAELSAKEEVIEAAFAKATEDLKGIASGNNQYDDSLAQLIKEAVDEIDSDNVVIQLNETDNNKFKSQLDSDSFEIEGISFQLGDPIDVLGGVLVKTVDGLRKVNKTISVLENIASNYDDLLVEMIVEAVDEINSKDVIIHLNETDTNKFKSQLDSDSFEIEGISFQLGEPIDVIGGVIVKNNDDDMVDNTIGSLDDFDSFDNLKYDMSLTKLIKEAVDEINSDDVIIHLNEADTNKFLNQLGSYDSFVIDGISFQIGEPIDTIGGVIVKTRNGDIEVNNTIESRLERFKSVLRSEVAKVLFK